MDDHSVTITEMAMSKLRHIMEKESRPTSGLRIAVQRTHCMGGRGYGYDLALEESSSTEDEVLEYNGIKVYIEKSSMKHLKGIELDYVENLTASGFIVKNPNAVAKCPCQHHDIFELPEGFPERHQAGLHGLGHNCR